MHCVEKITCGVIAFAFCASAESPSFSGAAALEHTRKVVAFGARPPASAASRQTQAYVHSHLKKLGAKILSYSFDTMTPRGPEKMTNLIGLLPGESRRSIVVSGHYDTKLMP